MLSLSRWDRTLNFFERFTEDETVHPSSRQPAMLELMGKHLGLFVERVETKDATDKTADDIEAQIKARLGLVLRAPGEREKKGGVYCPTQMAEVGL
jgi:hypothetical protein